MSILEQMKRRRLYVDGGSGTYFQSQGLKPGELPELWNLEHPDRVTQMHLAYLESGCDIITANTFGANPLKFPDPKVLEAVVSAAIGNAKSAIATLGQPDKYVALDLGPTGKLLKPLGDLAFEDAVELYAQVVRLGVACGVDLILIETMNDSYETKAAVLAAKENSSLPVFVTCAYDTNGTLMTGATPEAMVALLEGLRVDALGINCSFGPEQMLPLVKQLTAAASIPVIVNPNAGLPVVQNGITTYPTDPVVFGEIMTEIAQCGATILGGCCGTTPAHIQALVEKTRELPFSYPCPKEETVVSSYTHATSFSNKPVLIGERINPTGKPRFKEALREQNFDYILKEGVSQQEAGAHILDVNVGLPEIDEVSVLSETICRLQAVSDLPLQIDTANPLAMETALRIYNGKPLINSVNGKQESMDLVFPLAAKYGGVIIALTLDERGIPDTAEERLAIAEKIICEAKKYHISSKDLIFDPLAMTVSADPSSAQTTLSCLTQLRACGLKTSLGVSNISFGLPQRSSLNASFFTLAMEHGLSAAIMNPHSKEMMDAYYSFCALSNLDPMFEAYITYATKTEANTPSATTVAQAVDGHTALQQGILKGLAQGAVTATKQLLEQESALSIIDGDIIPALNQIGQAFEEKRAFLPQLLMSAEAAKAAFSVIKDNLSSTGARRPGKYKIILATVKGDIHDIGKNIVKVLLENYDFDVWDLGKDVPPETIVTAAKEANSPLVGLSALMTTTVPAMEETIRQLRAALPHCKVMVGGAVLTQDYADQIGADFYAKDAMAAVRYGESLVTENSL